jgi:hypothetical protein
VKLSAVNAVLSFVRGGRQLCSVRSGRNCCFFFSVLEPIGGHVVAWWLRHYAATKQKVAGQIPDEVFLLNLPHPSGRTRH